MSEVELPAPKHNAIQAAKELVGCGWLNEDLLARASLDSYALAVLRVAEHLEKLSDIATALQTEVDPRVTPPALVQHLRSLILRPSTPGEALRRAMSALLPPGKAGLTPNQRAQHVENYLRAEGYYIAKVPE